MKQTENTEQNHADQGVIVDPECLIKHPLQSTWTLWYQKPDRIKSWEDTLNEVTRFSTVEDFWSLLNHIKSLADNKVGSDYSLFKKDIRLMGKTIATSAAARSWSMTMRLKEGKWKKRANIRRLIVTLNNAWALTPTHFFPETGKGKLRRPY
ncbi:eukaryotic translation initiation factor 4E1-like [Aedes albopictus]|uniref:Uncharacterized protein n=1 Tax=Aedes albopictus TaxID=7160 RepID=A0ABM1YE39_AEDAL